MRFCLFEGCMRGKTVKLNIVKTTVLNFFRLTIVVAFCQLWTVYAQSENSFFQFIQDQSERHYSSVPHEVLAVYYVWYGAPPGIDAWGQVSAANHIISRTAQYPVQGAYNSQSTQVMDWHI